MQHQDLIKNNLLILFLSVFSLCAEMYQFHLSDRWYPSTKKKLHKTLDLLDLQYNHYESYDFSGKNIVALIVPHAAYQYSGALAVHIFKQLAHQSFDRIIILAVCNDDRFYGVALPGVAYNTYKTPLGIINLDRSVLNVLAKKSPLFSVHHELHELEHAIEVQVPLIQRYCNSCKIVPLIVGSVTLPEIDQVCDALKTFITERTLLVISSDFIQYWQNSYQTSLLGNVADFVQTFDNELIEKIQQQDLQGFLKILNNQNIIARGKNLLSILLRCMEKKIINVQNSFVLGHEYCYVQQADVQRVHGQNSAQQHCVSYVGMIMTQ